MADRAGFLLKPGCESSCFPQGLFFRPKNAFFLKTRVLRRPHSRRGFFFRPKSVFFLKTRVLRCPHSRRGFLCPQKTRPRVFPEAKVAFRVDETLVWHTPGNPADPPDLPDWCHQVPPRPSLPHAPGVRMTAVITNSLKLPVYKLLSFF